MKYYYYYNYFYHIIIIINILWINSLINFKELTIYMFPIFRKIYFLLTLN